MLVLGMLQLLNAEKKHSRYKDRMIQQETTSVLEASGSSPFEIYCNGGHYLEWERDELVNSGQFMSHGFKQWKAMRAQETSAELWLTAYPRKSQLSSNVS